MTEKRLKAIIDDLESLRREPDCAISETDVTVKELLKIAKMAQAYKFQTKQERAEQRKRGSGLQTFGVD